jgi:hypothetical protein
MKERGGELRIIMWGPYVGGSYFFFLNDMLVPQYFFTLMPHKRHVGRRPGQHCHVSATSAKTASKTTEGYSLYWF